MQRSTACGYTWLVLALLCALYTLNFLDRQLIGILTKPIQDELSLSDGQLGRLGGLYFALFYCVLAIQVGWLADRSNRGCAAGSGPGRCLRRENCRGIRLAYGLSAACAPVAPRGAVVRTRVSECPTRGRT